jgi:hypothetical protein
MKHRKESRRKAVVIHERRSGNREVLIRNDNGFYKVEVKDVGKIVQTITFGDLAKAMAASKALLKERSTS